MGSSIRKFWTGGRRRFVARLLSTLGFLLVGGLFTSEILETLSPVLRGLIGLGGFVALTGAVLVWSDEDSEKGER
jgi:hypothetical protein